MRSSWWSKNLWRGPSISTFFVIVVATGGFGWPAVGVLIAALVPVGALIEFRRRAELERQLWVDSSAVAFWLTVSGILTYYALAPVLELPEPDLGLLAFSAIVLRGLIRIGMHVTHSD